MKKEDLKHLYEQIETDQEFDNQVRKRVLGHKKEKYFYLPKKIAMTLVATVFIFCVMNISVYALSSEYREWLGDMLHIKSSDTHFIGNSASDNGYKMTVVSTHVVKDSAVIFMTLEKENGEIFTEEYASKEIVFTIDGKEFSDYTYYTELSEDKKVLYCYYEWYFAGDVNGKEAEMNVKEWTADYSLGSGSIYRIEGEWKVAFTMQSDEDNTVLIVNRDKSKTISMCGKELQIDSILITDMRLIANTTVLSDKGRPKLSLRSISDESGMYYGIYIKLKYKDGTISESYDFNLDRKGNIIASTIDVIDKNNVEAVIIGEHTFQR